MNILYIGPNDSEWAQENRPVSLAGAKWARGFLTALSNRVNLYVLTHTHEYPWPKGRRILSEINPLLHPDAWPCETVRYPVLKWIRELWFSVAYPIKARRIIKDKKIDAVLFYNCEYWHERHIINAVAQCGVPCFPIILDGDDPRKDEWAWLKEGLKRSAGVIPLSWWVYENIPKHVKNIPVYHLDGGADIWCGMPPNLERSSNVFTLVHTGALDQWRGLNFMVELVERYARPNTRFIFCGKSSEKILHEKFDGNPYVELPGLVSESELNQICNSADVLLNVRDPKHPDNILNYPSKLPHYLSFGRPIVSTHLQSLSPDYEEVVHFADDDSVEAYILKLNEIRLWTNERKMNEYMRIKDWFEKKKRWDVLVGGLVNWIAKII